MDVRLYHLSDIGHLNFGIIQGAHVLFHVLLKTIFLDYAEVIVLIHQHNVSRKLDFLVLF